jgi:hypothetical protein
MEKYSSSWGSSWWFLKEVKVYYDTIEVIANFRRRVAYEIREETCITWIRNEKSWINLEKDRR